MDVEHLHPLDKVTRHPRLFLGNTSKRLYVIRARKLKHYAYEIWSEFEWPDKVILPWPYERAPE